MNKYETVILISNKTTVKERENVISKIEGLISNNGIVTKTENIGEKKLAYEVRKNTHAFYYIIEFEANSEFIAELERVYRITDEIIKFIVIRQES